jgi:tetratricopeptide (TPR) repeat protein
MIVRNEERNLGRCLDSIRDLVQELIVVDTGSTDRTREIALDYGARVVDMVWCDDFAAARNCFMDAATGDYILWMDADDVLPASQRAPLQQLLSSLDYSPRAFHFWVNSLSSSPSNEANSLTQIRLFRTNPQLRWTRRVHEQICPACDQLGYTHEYTDIQIQHLGYRDGSLMQRKINRDLRLLRMEYATDPLDAGTLLYLGLNLMKTGKQSEALGYLLRAYQVTLESSREYVATIISMLVDCLIQSGQTDQAWNISVEGMRRFPGDRSLTLQHATILFNHKQNTRAIHLLRDCLARPQVRGNFFGSSDLLNGRAMKTLLARIYTDEQCYADAERLYQELISEDPSNANLWGYLGALYLIQNRFSDLEHAISQVQKCPEGPGVAEVLRAAIQFEHHHLDAARKHCEEAILLQPKSSWARAMLCQILYRQQDPDGQLENALQDLLRLDPLNQMGLGMLQELKQRQNFQHTQWTVNVNM